MPATPEFNYFKRIPICVHLCLSVVNPLTTINPSHLMFGSYSCFNFLFYLSLQLQNLRFAVTNSQESISDDDVAFRSLKPQVCDATQHEESMTKKATTGSSNYYGVTFLFAVNTFQDDTLITNYRFPITNPQSARRNGIPGSELIIFKSCNQLPRSSRNRKISWALFL